MTNSAEKSHDYTRKGNAKYCVEYRNPHWFWLTLYTLYNEVWGKVMFINVSVILSTGVAEVSVRDRPPPPGTVNGGHCSGWYRRLGILL